MNTAEGGIRVRETMIAKHGSEEAWKAYMRKIASEGGKRGTTGGFWHKKYIEGDLHAVIEAGKKGGRISRRGKKVNA